MMKRVISLFCLAAVMIAVSIPAGTSWAGDKEAKAGKGECCGWTETFFVDKADLSDTGENPYFILKPGYKLTLEGRGKKSAVRLDVTVLDETKMVDGVLTRVVEEREWLNGELEEVSRNFFAIDKRTNSVYYFGEDVEIYEDGEYAGTEGEWQSGADGARFGLIMPGTVLLGSRYYEEHAPGAAMDRAEIVAVDCTMKTPAGEFEHCLKVQETNPLEADEKEYKMYALGIGLIVDENLKLVKYGYAD